jgi:PAS domain S-box-containing protein
MSHSLVGKGHGHEEHFRRLFEEAPLPYQSLDAEGRLLEVNEEWEKLLGHRREQVLGRFFGEFLAPGQEESLNRSFQAFLVNGTTEGVFLTLLSKDGSEKLVEIKGRIALDDQGEFQRTHCILYDITEGRRMESALRESEEKYRLAMEVTQDGLWDWNIRTGQAEYSGAWSRILGEESVQNKYSTWEDRIHPDDKPRVLASLDSLRA